RTARVQLGPLCRHGRVREFYWPFVAGGPDPDEGRIALPPGRLDATRGWWMKPDPHGQPAVTRWRVMGQAEESPPPVAALARGDTLPLRERDKRTWLALEPLTGRTHQLRVHCAAMGWPVVGDAIYGTAPRTGGPPLHLHAREIGVPLYPKSEPVQVIAPVPAHMREALTACGWQREDRNSGPAAPAEKSQPEFQT